MKTVFILLLAISGLPAQSDLSLTITKGAGIHLAVPDFRGAGRAGSVMATFNQTLWDDLDESGMVVLQPKTSYPKTVPQQPGEMRTQEWAGPPVSAAYAVIGYAAEQAGLLVVYGWLVDVRKPSASVAFSAHYQESEFTDAAARKIAHEFAADLIRTFGGKTTAGTRIYFTSDRSGDANLWSMDPDGANQHQITHLKSPNMTAVMSPAVSTDGRTAGFVSHANFYAEIAVLSLNPVSALRFENPAGHPTVTTPSFTPDGKRVLYSQSGNIYIADLDGKHPQRITAGANNGDVSPTVNPKTGTTVAFISGRAGHDHLYIMNMDGGDVTALTSGDGYADNPSWHPSGQRLAYACTNGNLRGSYHTCIMDVATQKISIEIPTGGDRDENPVWAPDGVHIVFMRTTGGKEQIWTMLSDGTHQRQLTSTGRNRFPVWSAH